MDLDDCSYVDLYAVIEGRARLNPSCEARQVYHEQTPVIQSSQREGKKQVTSMVSGLKTPHPGYLPSINKGKMKFELNSSICSDQHYASANKSLRKGYEVNRNQEKATSQHQSKGLVRITEKSRSDKADSRDFNVGSSHRTHGQSNTKSVVDSINSGSRYNTRDGYSFCQSQYKEYSVVMREDEAFDEDRLASAARSTNRTNSSRVVNKKSDNSVIDRSRRDPSRESLKNLLRTRAKERSCSRSPRRRARSCDAMRSMNRSRSPELTQRVKMALDRSPKRNISHSKDRLEMHGRIPIAGMKKDPKVHESLDKSSRSSNDMHEDTRAVEGKQNKAYTFDRLSKQGRSARSQSPLGNQRSQIPVRVRSSSRIVQQGSERSMHSENLDMKRHHTKNLAIGQRSSKELKCRSQSPLLDPRRRFIQLQQGEGKIRDGRSSSDRLNTSEKKSNGGKCKSTNNLSNHQPTPINNRSQSPTTRKKM